MPVNFRKAKATNLKCTSCGADYAHSIMMVEYRIGSQHGVLCDLCAKELFNKTLSVTCMIDKEPKDSRQTQVKNLRGQARSNLSKGMMTINEALREVKDDNE